MALISLLQIAPTLAGFFGVHLNSSQTRPVEQILKFAYFRNPIPKVVVLVMADSLDFRFYADFADELEGIHELVKRDGLIFECETVSSHTAPECFF